MKVVHSPVTTNRRTRALAVTGNFLERDRQGAYHWAEPNDRWRLFATKGKQKALLTNLRRDDTEHSPDLWLYSTLTKKEYDRVKAEPDWGRELMEANAITLDRTRRWYVRQFIKNPNRIGIKRFTGLTLGSFWDLWRARIDATEIQIYGLSNRMAKIVWRDYQVNVYLDWPELQSDLNNSQSSITKGSTQWTVSEKVMPWLHVHCEHGFIPFSDYDITFPDTQDEFSYIADVA